MNDTSFVCRLQCLCDLLGYRKGFIERNGTLSNAICEGWPLHQLQHQRTGCVRFFEAVDGRDVRVAQAGENLRFPLEPRQPIRISRKRLRQDLQRHLPVQLGIGGLIDLSHAALADKGGHVVMAESGTDFERHRPPWGRNGELGLHYTSVEHV